MIGRTPFGGLICPDCRHEYPTAKSFGIHVVSVHKMFPTVRDAIMALLPITIEEQP